MTPAQRRRLEAVAAGLAPCIACLRHDIVELEAGIARISADGSGSRFRFEKLARQLHASLETDSAAEEPSWDEECRAELRQERRAAEAERDHLQAILRQLLSMLPSSNGRASCRDCRARKVIREMSHNLANQLRKSLDRESDLVPDGEEDAGGGDPRTGAYDSDHLA